MAQTKQCEECGQSFTVPRPDRIAVVCSRACNVRRHDRWQESQGRSGWARRQREIQQRARS